MLSYKEVLVIFYSLNINVFSESINIKILNAGAWARSSERVSVTLPMELEDYIPQVEEFYRLKHSGRKLQWHHLMSNGIVCFSKNSIVFYTSIITLLDMHNIFSFLEKYTILVQYFVIFCIGYTYLNM